MSVYGNEGAEVDPAAAERVREYLRQFDRLHDTAGIIHQAFTDPESEGAALTSADLRALLTSGAALSADAVSAILEAYEPEGVAIWLTAWVMRPDDRSAIERGVLSDWSGRQPDWSGSAASCVDPWVHDDGRCDQSCWRDAQ